MLHILAHVFHVLAAGPAKVDPNGIVPTGNTTIGGGLTKVIKTLLTLIGSLSVIFIMVGGLLMVLASGNPARFKQGREAVIYASVGIGVAISGYAIVTFLTSRLG